MAACGSSFDGGGFDNHRKLLTFNTRISYGNFGPVKSVMRV